MGGGENVRSKDAATLHQAPETFLSSMVMDGVFEREPNLRGAAVELGAGWVPELLRRLDVVTKTYARVDTNLAAFTRKPSEQLTTQMGFTPFTEGGRDPIARFEASLASSAPAVKDKFYAENFLRLFPSAA
jgi:uncharacterized protein